MSRVDKRIVVSAFVAVAFVSQLALAGVAYFWRAGEQNDLAKQQQRLQQLRGQASRREAPPAPTPPVAERRQLLSGPDVVATLQILQQLGDEAGVVFDSQQALRATSAGKQTFSVTGHGTPEQVCAFVAGIEQHDRLMVVETGRVLPASEATIAFELGVATYHGGER